MVVVGAILGYEWEQNSHNLDLTYFTMRPVDDCRSLRAVASQLKFQYLLIGPSHTD
jgi:hypothetical protein